MPLYYWIFPGRTQSLKYHRNPCQDILLLPAISMGKWSIKSTTYFQSLDFIRIIEVMHKVCFLYYGTEDWGLILVYCLCKNWQLYKGSFFKSFLYRNHFSSNLPKTSKCSEVKLLIQLWPFLREMFTQNVKMTAPTSINYKKYFRPSYYYGLSQQESCARWDHFSFHLSFH